MVDAVRQAFQAALAFQQRRCEAYNSWRDHFQQALAGDVAASDLDHLIHTVVIKEFQAVSAGLRQLQTSVADSMRDVAGMNAVEPRAFLIRWIDRIQEVEKAHYEVSVQLASALAGHSEPNVVPLYVRQAALDAAVAARAKQRALAREAAKHAEAKKELEGLHPPHAHAEGHTPCGCAAEAARRVTAEPATDASAADVDADAGTAVPLKPSMSLHDDELCPFLHAMHRHERGALFFVHCSHTVDLLGDESEQEGEEAVPESPTTPRSPSEDIDEVQSRISARAGEVALTDRQERVMAYYTPTSVAMRCLKAERECSRLRQRKHKLQAEASELYEELQCEYSDL